MRPDFWSGRIVRFASLRGLDLTLTRTLALFAALALPLSACSEVPVLDGASAKVEAAKARNDGPALWRVRDDDSTLYLYGTVHLLPDGLDWQRDDLLDVFGQAGTVFFEADSEGVAGAQAQALVTRRGLRTDGLRLSDQLDSYQAKLLEAVSHNGGVPLAQLDSMQPWLATELLTLAAAESAGLSADMSPDAALRSRARRQGKNVAFLERAEDQILQVADLPVDVQLSVLTDTMERFDDTPALLERTARDWAAGDVDALERDLMSAMADAPPAYLDAVLTRRNADWAEQLSAWMDGSGTAVAVVGTLHLLGENSLLDALEERGLAPTRYLAFMGEDVIKPANVRLPPVPGDGE